jgi:hypothetical protein
MTRFRKCDMIDCSRTATKKIRLYLPIKEEYLGPITRTHVKSEGFDIRTRSYALKRSMRMSVCKVCYDGIDVDGFEEDGGININVDGQLQKVTMIRKL